MLLPFYYRKGKQRQHICELQEHAVLYTFIMAEGREINVFQADEGKMGLVLLRDCGPMLILRSPKNWLKVIIITVLKH